jgi:hypothetical protein
VFPAAFQDRRLGERRGEQEDQDSHRLPMIPASGHAK